MRESRLRRFGHVQRMHGKKKVTWYKLREQKNFRRAKIISVELIKNELSIKEWIEYMTSDKVEWTKRRPNNPN